MTVKRVSLLAMLIVLIWGIVGVAVPVRADRATELEVEGLKRKIGDYRRELGEKLDSKDFYVINVSPDYKPPEKYRKIFIRLLEIRTEGKSRLFWIVNKRGYDQYVSDMAKEGKPVDKYIKAKDNDSRNRDFLRNRIRELEAEIAALERKLDQQDVLGLRHLPKIRGKSMPQSVDGLVSFIEELRKQWIKSCSAKKEAFRQEVKRAREAKNDKQAALYDKKAADIHFILTDKINGDASRLVFFARANERDPDKLKLVWKTIKCYDDKYGGCITETIHPGINKCNEEFGEACKELDSQRR